MNFDANYYRVWFTHSPGVNNEDLEFMVTNNLDEVLDQILSNKDLVLITITPVLK